ncbi:heme ABC transporter ATP-binding protein [Rosenbergiella nectarea]|uniref:heme ABC transporter ATP-binding protein n=1 Tax=Rosenbergiella nectarea TaxID=988801 RepID=UPI001BD9F3D3|nr:heme ABC transporter ATP-binding protein [Rosenbergiella nectarea]MBT0731091.1 heme ABC transporter ATP-binding protein [Rosenbergiella nectarea subsp. apis]
MHKTLSARQLGLQIGSRTLITPLDLKLELGEFVTIMGPNGAGKSTLLRLLTGFLSATEGECLLAGKPYAQWDRSQLASQRAVMRQHNQLAFAMSAEEVILLGISQYATRRQRTILEQVVALIGCQMLCDRNYATLSGGEQQQIQLARVLAQLWKEDEPEGWLFLDEPTSALDLFHQQHLLRLLHRLTRNGRLMVCAVLHDVNLAATWSDRIVVMRQGALVADGSVQQVLTESQLTAWYQAELSVIQPASFSHPIVLLNK